jgi:NTE family protein
MIKKNALVLTGGGARGSYQAGVLLGIAEVLGDSQFPFQIISGVSAGAINGAFLAGRQESFSDSVQHLCELWSELRTKAVVKTDPLSLGWLAARWMKDLGSGGAFGQGSATHLLDSTPLRELIRSHVDFQKLKSNVTSGQLHGVCFTATNYRTGTAVTFYDGAPSIEPWARSARLGRRVDLALEHVLASSSIPIFFKPVPSSGSYWGDGGVRLGTPLSPAIHLGADRILAIGIRYARPDERVYQLNEGGALGEITLADIGGVLMNALFLDALDSDVERLQRINQTVDLLSSEKTVQHPAKLRKIPLLAIKPSRDLGSLAADQFKNFPWVLRHLLRGTGAGKDKGWDMVSYLAFDRSYTSKLIEVGREDALKLREEILRFFTTNE